MCKNPLNVKNQYNKLIQIKDGKLTIIMQNKANFKKAKMNISYYLKKDFENKPCFFKLRKQSQTKPKHSRHRGRLNGRSLTLTALYSMCKYEAPSPTLQKGRIFSILFFSKDVVQMMLNRENLLNTYSVLHII